MNYHFRTNYYSVFLPKRGISSIKPVEKGIHGIFFPSCNFRCIYCNNENHPKCNYSITSIEQFRKTIQHAILTGKFFKFTGGEPLTNPDLQRDIKIVKDLGGDILIDTNGSRPKIVDNILSNFIIDTIGISLKGLTKKQSMQISRINNPVLCWDNVFNTLSCCASHPKTRVIVTMVFHDNMGYKEIVEFARLMEPYPRVCLKFNNLLLNQQGLSDFRPLSTGKLQSLLEEFINKNPQWDGRCFIVDEIEAVRDSNRIITL